MFPAKCQLRVFVHRRHHAFQWGSSCFLLAWSFSVASITFGATITGSVKGPDGAPFMGAFVIAENSQNKMTLSVLSDKQGHYHFANLPAATYALRIRAIGYNSEPRTACSWRPTKTPLLISL